MPGMVGSGRVVLSLAVGALLAALVAAPVSGVGPQPQPPPQEKKEKKKARKVWTNDDIPALQKSRGVSVVGRPRPAAEAAPPAAAQAPAAAESQEQNFYSEISLEERAEWIAKFEQEIAQGEQMLSELRDRRFTAPTEDDRRKLDAQIAELEQAVEENRAEIELIRNTPPPPPAKSAKPKTPSAPAPPQPPTPPSS